jgi:predicted AlkP superfamily pyrophosphatase or phosphodiesterase
VANGWLFRDTREVRFWQQSNALIQREPLYQTAAIRAKQKGIPFTSAKLFWWFNQGAAVDYSVTPKPWYGVDGNKAFGIAGSPAELPIHLEKVLGPFPFPAFWGPTAGLPATQWIAHATAEVLKTHAPTLTLAYLPHLDYEPQRLGPSGCNMAKHVKELDDACAPILDEAARLGAKVWVLSEYGHCDVDQPVEINRALRNAVWLEVRHGPFGEQLDLYASRAFAVVDHQLAHIYVKDVTDVPAVETMVKELPGVAETRSGDARADWGLNHPRSGEIVAISDPKAWFAYAFWMEDRFAPDYARAVAIHHKPGFDPCELFWDPHLALPKLRAARRLIQKKLGFRTIFDVVPLDNRVVRGSHGLVSPDVANSPILIGHGPNPGSTVPMTSVKDIVLNALSLS